MSPGGCKDKGIVAQKVVPSDGSKSMSFYTPRQEIEPGLPVQERNEHEGVCDENNRSGWIHGEIDSRPGPNDAIITRRSTTLVQRYTPELEKRGPPHLKLTNDSWRVDETYVKVKTE